jgi:hypothetical protein
MARLLSVTATLYLLGTVAALLSFTTAPARAGQVYALYQSATFSPAGSEISLTAVRLLGLAAPRLAR